MNVLTDRRGAVPAAETVSINIIGDAGAEITKINKRSSWHPETSAQLASRASFTNHFVSRQICRRLAHSRRRE